MPLQDFEARLFIGAPDDFDDEVEEGGLVHEFTLTARLFVPHEQRESRHPFNRKVIFQKVSKLRSDSAL